MSIFRYLSVCMYIKNMSSGVLGWLSWLSVRLNFGSGHDLMVHEIEPHIGFCADSTEPSWDSLSLPLPCLHAHKLSLALKINK